jgi:hypothetical protein
MSDTPDQDAKKPVAKKPAKQESAWWSNLVIAVLMLAGAGWMYYDLTKLEAEGGTRRVRSIVKAVYELGGKWAVVGIFLALAALFVYLALAARRKQST